MAPKLLIRGKLRVLPLPPIFVLRIVKQAVLYSEEITVNFYLEVLDLETIVPYVSCFRINGIISPSSSYKTGWMKIRLV